MGKGFDEYASAYDAWFLDNRNVLYSEVNLVAATLRDAGRVLSVGCGSGLFESILRKEYGITVTDGIEPSVGMAEIARKRGMNVTIATAEEADFGHGDYDTLLFNGTPSYIGDLEGVVHWLRLNDGAFAARAQIGGPITGQPVVSDGVVVVQTTEGQLAAFALQ